MTDSRTRWEIVQELFHRLLEVERSERDHLLETLCDDPGIRAEVRSLLHHDAVGGSLLDRNIAEAASLLAETVSPEGRMAGPYRIERLLGEGGMGVVYLATRPDLGTSVALKMLRDAWVSPSRRERFAREQRTHAQLVHPSIARVYDAATLPDGTPFFAMELVEGEPLTDFCRTRQSSLEERLRLLLEVCDAVHFAHQRAVIHRDLKPSNILVTKEGAIRLLDFGIARSLQEVETDGGRTGTGMRFFSPAYAAPEQVRGESVGVFTDVYALGVLLYELLTGVHPFVMADQRPRELESAVVRGTPVRPSARVRTTSPAAAPDVRRVSRSRWDDLDVLCLTAMHPDPERRYPSVEALVRDIDHYLRGEVLEARPPSVVYRTMKFLRRNAAAAAGVTAGTLLVVGLTTFYTIRLAEAGELARAEAESAQQISDYLVELFESGDPYQDPGGADNVDSLLQRGRAKAEELSGRPEVYARMLNVLGRVEMARSRYGPAQELLEQALAIRRVVSPGSLDVAETLTNLGTVHHYNAAQDSALEAFGEALGIYTRELSAGDPTLANALDNVGVVHGTIGEYAAADDYYRRALAIRRQRGAEAPDDLGYSLNNVAVNLYNQGRLEEARTFYVEALKVERDYYGADHPAVATTMANLARLHQDIGEFAEAEALLTGSLRIRRSTLGDEHYETVLGMSQLGGLFQAMDAPDRARPHLEEALALRERILGPDHPGVGTTQNSLGLVLLQLGELDAAETAFRRVIGIYSRSLGPEHRFTGVALANLGSVLHARGELYEAELAYRQGLATLAAVHPAGHPELAFHQGGLGSLLIDRGAMDEGRALLEAARDGLSTAYGVTDPRTLRFQDRLAGLARGG